MSDYESLPLFPLRNSVLYPFILSPFSAGRPLSVKAFEAALGSGDKAIVAAAQRNAREEHPGGGDFFAYGTRAVIKKMARTEETIESLLQGVERVAIEAIEQQEPYVQARVRRAPVAPQRTPEVEALQREVVRLTLEHESLTSPVHEIDIAQAVRQIREPLHLVYFIASIVGLDVEQAQAVLDADTHFDALQRLHVHLVEETRIQRLREEIAGRAESEINRQQREYLLRQQLRAIQQQLGEEEGGEPEAVLLRRRLEEAPLPPQVRSEAEREFKRLERIQPSSPEYQVAQTHLDLVLELPWERETEDILELRRARQVLDEDHFDLDDIKERILEHLAVLKLNPEAQAPILCFVGPPGVGKTSLGQSIARALGRKFERFSLGGMHDEAELRGHRRTYIGALPGRIIQAIRRAGSRNPLLMLDEIDKLGRDFRGDPASALLEVLDPAQNFAFRDNYLDLPFDLSRVFFITTANTLESVPRPLLDRMEVIRLSGYSSEEKLAIARRYLIERQRRQAGLGEAQFQLSDATLIAVIERYTREAGVRELERLLGGLARKFALRIAEGRALEPLTPETLPHYLGPPRFFMEQARTVLPPGVATGLAWTETGGDVLFIECLRLPAGEPLTLTGQLGQVMQESARAAQNWVISNSEALGVKQPAAGIHVHVPAGAIPKDGPSAGVTMAVAIASLYTELPVRSDTAMTGEITLTGLVLPVGGIREKVLAAKRAGIRRVILPQQNESDLAKLPESTRASMEFILAERIERALQAAIPELEPRLNP